ncbi:MAG TPA: hypothetical protein VFR09_06595 [Alphaproteobacteria bacterium]|nr:hypothetical protein [Alphaproteobacteria bacterium]
MFSFHDLEMKFGSVAAYQFLAEIEKAARIPASGRTDIDPETRLADALRVQDNFPAVA